MSNLYRGHGIDASYQVSVHLAKRFQRRRLKTIGQSEIRLQTWPPQTILVSDWLISKKSSLKPLGQLNRNLVGSILGRSSIKIAHLVPPRMLPTKFRFIWPSGFRGEDFFRNQSIRIACGGHVAATDNSCF
jgi:hypothetical protein